ncbi:MAG: aldehyde ferredoxin oxidoreductase C-terminal domain-containing protein [Desulfatiglandales bacterium]
MTDNTDKNNPEVLIQAEKCTGCMNCQLICSFHYSGAFNPGEARIRIMGIDEKVMTDYYRQNELNREDLQSYLDAYYEERGWEPTKGIPGRDKLKELGLMWAET